MQTISAQVRSLDRIYACPVLKPPVLARSTRGRPTGDGVNRQAGARVFSPVEAQKATGQEPVL